MLVRTHNRAVNEDLLEICIDSQRGKDPMPDTGLGPSGQPFVRAAPVPELLRQVASWASRTGDPEHHLDKFAVICG